MPGSQSWSCTRVVVGIRAAFSLNGPVQGGRREQVVNGSINAWNCIKRVMRVMQLVSPATSVATPVRDPRQLPTLRTHIVELTRSGNTGEARNFNFTLSLQTYHLDRPLPDYQARQPYRRHMTTWYFSIKDFCAQPIRFYSI